MKSFLIYFLLIIACTLIFIVTIFSCKKDELVRQAKVQTLSVSEIMAITAKAEGNLIDLGTGITDHGHCWGAEANPVVGGSATSLGAASKTGTYTSNLQWLESGKLYHLRAYAKCGDKIVYGDDKTFTTTSDPGAPAIGTTTAGNALATVTFTAPADDGGLAITGYTVTSNPGNKTASGSASPLTVTGLTNGIAYTFTVTATNANGAGLTSAASNSVTPSTISESPTNIIASAGNAQATLTFTAPANDGGSVITGYKATSNPGDISVTAAASPLIVTGLSNGTPYTFTVTAMNTNGSSQASTVSNTIMPAISGIVYDVEGNVYKTVTIGTRVWMAENLKTTKFNDNTSIPWVTAYTKWESLTTPGYNWYADQIYYKATYGALYNWFAIDAASNGGKNICPAGWHVPTDLEWNTLVRFLGGEGVAGGKLKETGTSHWSIETTGTTNETGFTGLPGGACHFSGGFSDMSYFGYWWSSTEYTSTSSWGRYLSINGSSMQSTINDKRFGFSIRCLQGDVIINVPSAPIIETVSAGNGQAAVIFSAPVSDGGSVITSYTVTSSPGGLTASGTGSPLTVTGLTNRTAYTFTVSATNENGTGSASAASNSVTPAISGTSISDIDGNLYYTVDIGTQVWMAENLRTTKYNDNTDIPLVTDNTAWSVLTTPGYSWYRNDETTYKSTYGALYNWFTVDAASNGGKNVCPVGWHVPGDSEWTTLTTFLGGDAAAGDKLKETGITHWLSPSTEPTNETGFTALPGGYRVTEGLYGSVGNEGKWWSSTMYNGPIAWYRYMYFNISYVGRDGSYKPYGLSIRCLRDN
jgi:uncharacterized protein (TIGR02145 family)